MSEQNTITTVTFETTYRVPRAVTLRSFGIVRADLGGWMAKISGKDAHYGLARTFLSKTYPSRYAKRPIVAYDCSEVVSGDILEVRGMYSRSTPMDMFYRVQQINEIGMTLLLLDEQEIATLYH